jgi:short-subunit dehydrogenase
LRFLEKIRFGRAAIAHHGPGDVKNRERSLIAVPQKASLEAVAKQITTSGGEARTAAIDTLADASTNRYIDGNVTQAGRIDIAIDAAGPLAKEYGNGKNAVDLPIEEFMVPLATW